MDVDVKSTRSHTLNLEKPGYIGKFFSHRVVGR